jgi:hypothetical protein
MDDCTIKVFFVVGLMTTQGESKPVAKLYNQDTVFYMYNDRAS